MKCTLFPGRWLWVGGLLCLLLGIAPTFAQSGGRVTVTGKILGDTDRAPLIGATITEKGTNNGTVADVEGNYKLSVMPEAGIVVSFIGYVSQEIKIGSRSVISAPITFVCGGLRRYRISAH